MPSKTYLSQTYSVKHNQAVHDFVGEAEIMHYSVFSESYYLKENSLIPSATIEGDGLKLFRFY